MLSSWKTVRLDELATIRGGGTPSRSEAAYFGGAVPWVTPTDLPPIGRVEVLGQAKETLTDAGLRNSSATLIPEGSVLFSSRASIGKIVVTERVCATNQGFANFTPRPGKVLPWFLAYLLCRYTTELKELAGKTTFLEIPRGKLKGFEVAIPHLDEQQRVVIRIRECMERVDEIEALRAKLTKDAESLGSAVFADYVESLDPSGIEPSALGDVLIECTYGTSNKANTNKEGDPVLRMGNIKDRRLDTSKLKYVQLPPKEREKYRLCDGDILINRTNSLELVGKSAVFTGLDGDWVFASYLIRLRVDRRKALPEYVNAVINSRIGRNYVLRTARRAIGMVNINAKEIQRMPLPLPPLKVQEAIVKQAADASVIVDQVNRLLAEDGASHLRESILRKAFAGQL